MINNLPTPKCIIYHIGKRVDKFTLLMKIQHDIIFGVIWKLIRKLNTENNLKIITSCFRSSYFAAQKYMQLGWNNSKLN